MRTSGPPFFLFGWILLLPAKVDPQNCLLARGGMSEPMSIFLSHNSADKPYVRKLAAALTVAGTHVWFDEWTIRPGDSIPGAIDQGLSAFSTFVLVWSRSASESRWVHTEMEAAINRVGQGERHSSDSRSSRQDTRSPPPTTNSARRWLRW